MNEPTVGTRVSIDGRAWTVVPDPDTDALVVGVLALLDDAGRDGLLRCDQETGQWTCWTPPAPVDRPVQLLSEAPWAFVSAIARPVS